MTRGRTVASDDPFDLGAVGRSDEIFDALADRLSAEPFGSAQDPAVRMLAALAADVDVGAPPLPTSARVIRGTPVKRRRGVVTLMTFGAAMIMLTSTSAATAGGPGGGVTISGTTDYGRSARSNAVVRHRAAGSPVVNEARPTGAAHRRQAVRVPVASAPGHAKHRPHDTRRGGSVPAPGPSKAPTPPAPSAPVLAPGPRPGPGTGGGPPGTMPVSPAPASPLPSTPSGSPGRRSVKGEGSSVHRACRCLARIPGSATPASRPAGPARAQQAVRLGGTGLSRSGLPRCR